MNKGQQRTSGTQNMMADFFPFPDEIEKLEDIMCELTNALEEADADVKRIDREYMDTKRYMMENRGDIDPHEMFQNELGLKDIDRTGMFAVLMRDRIVKLRDSPYFARIDFRNNEKNEADVFYIGRFTFNRSNRLLITDWRSPVASMYYDCEVGPAGYTAPVGRIDGELVRKRQFKIANGKMVYAFESSINIGDDILQQELSRTSDEKMKSIISSIQKEQNQIIRNEKADTLIIQGVAGSGKTSIALHRIAFLLYQQGEKLSAKNVTILSPNKVFGDYISNVLPELGEEPIYEVSLADIAKAQLEGVIEFEEDRDPLEENDAGWKERVQFKSTLGFMQRLDDFTRQLPDMVFVPADYTYGQFMAKADTIRERFRAYAKYPLKQRLRMVADDIYDRFYTDNLLNDDMPKSRTILKALNKMLKIKSTLTLYKEFYKWAGMPKMLVMPQRNTLEWADVYPFLYIYAAFEGLSESGVIKHLVVDEMQDYTMVQYAVLNLLFKCQKTILGDFGQLVNPNHLPSLEDLKQLYSGAEFVQLSKSYRSTYEIIAFAKQIKSAGEIEAIERHGVQPAVTYCSDSQSELLHIKRAVREFLDSKYSSLGIITKRTAEAKQLYSFLSKDFDVHLITPESTSFENGISITSVQMSKGLEFDQVIIPHVNSKTYCTDYDRNLLYIACTRAMHKLLVSYTGEVSPLLP